MVEETIYRDTEIRANSVCSDFSVSIFTFLIVCAVKHFKDCQNWQI